MFILFLLHGVSAFKILAILLMNFQIPKKLGARRMTPYAIWAFNMAIMFANELCDGYQFGAMWSSLAFLVRAGAGLHSAEPG